MQDLLLLDATTCPASASATTLRTVPEAQNSERTTEQCGSGCSIHITHLNKVYVVEIPEREWGRPAMLLKLLKAVRFGS